MGKRFYYIQNIAALIILILLHQKSNPFSLPSWSFYLFVIVLFASLIPFQSNAWNKINLVLQSFVQSWALIYAWTQFFYLCSFKNALGIILQSVLCLYYIVLCIPFALQVAARIKNSVWRFVFILWQFDAIVLTNSSGPDNLFINKSMILGAVAFLLFVLLVMHSWGYSLPRLRGIYKLNIWVVITLTTITLIEVFLNVVENMPNFNIIIHRVLTQPALFLSGLEAGIAEELTFRYASFGLLFYIFRKKTWGLPVSILLINLLFGSMHFVNLGYGGQTFEATLIQATSAVGLGIICSIIYLYSGRLIISMFIHFVNDWGIFIVHGTKVAGASILGPAVKYVAGDVPTLIELGIILIFFAWMMHGKRRQVMEEHARALIGE